MEKKIMLATFKITDKRMSFGYKFHSVSTIKEFEKYIKKNENRIIGNTCDVVFMGEIENAYKFTFEEIRSMEFFQKN